MPSNPGSKALTPLLAYVFTQGLCSKDSWAVSFGSTLALAFGSRSQRTRDLLNSAGCWKEEYEGRRGSGCRLGRDQCKGIRGRGVARGSTHKAFSMTKEDKNERNLKRLAACGFPTLPPYFCLTRFPSYQMFFPLSSNSEMIGLPSWMAALRRALPGGAAMRRRLLCAPEPF